MGKWDRIMHRLILAVATPLVVIMIQIGVNLWKSLLEVIRYGWADIIVFVYIISMMTAIIYWYIATIMDMIKEELHDTDRDK